MTADFVRVAGGVVTDEKHGQHRDRAPRQARRRGAHAEMRFKAGWPAAVDQLVALFQ